MALAGSRIIPGEDGSAFWQANGSAGWFILGCTILGGALMSHYVNRFWDDNGAFGIFPLHEPPQNRTSFTWSCILGAIGTLLVIFALAKHAAAI